MEIALMNRQDVAGTGLKDGRKTGIVEYRQMGNTAPQEKTGKKNRIILGLGVLYNGGIKPSAPREVPTSCVGAGAFRNNTTDPAAPGPDPCERSGNLLFSCYERQELLRCRNCRSVTRCQGPGESGRVFPDREYPSGPKNTLFVSPYNRKGYANPGSIRGCFPPAGIFFKILYRKDPVMASGAGARLKKNEKKGIAGSHRTRGISCPGLVAAWSLVK